MAGFFLFEDFRLDQRGGGLFRRDNGGVFVPVEIGSRALDVLGVLVERSGDLISKDQIMDAVWPGIVVEDNNLTVQISTLRRILDQGRAGGSCIRTAAGRGYRFVAAVTRHEAGGQSSPTPVEHPNSEASVAQNSYADGRPQPVENIAEPAHVLRAAPSPATLPLPDKPSIAVLPFANMSNDPDQEFFADGIADDITTTLSRYPSLFVIARNSCFTYKGRAVDVKQVGRELGVRYVLEGSLRKSADRIRVTAQLVEAETGTHVWRERYDRDLADIFAVQDEITEAVTIAVAPAIADAELHRAMRKPPENHDAWAAYQRGLWHMSQFNAGDNALAEAFFQQAIDLAPHFVGGYCGLSVALFNAGIRFQARNLFEVQSSMEFLARRAVALSGADAEARACLGLALLARGDVDGASMEAERALALTPNLAFAHESYGRVLGVSGRPKEALVEVETSIRIDPLGPTLAERLLLVTIYCYYSGEYSFAVEAAKRVIRSYPDFPMPYRWLAAALGQLGRAAEAKEVLETAVAIAPVSFEMFVRGRVPFVRPEDHAHMLAGLHKAGWKG